MTAGASILVVDDTPRNAKLLADLLAANGFAVATAASGPEALELLRKEPADLVLLDVVMPGMSGYDVCREIRRREDTGYLPVILVTALDPDEERMRGLEAGADDFLTKPVNLGEVLGRVRSLLRIRALHETVRQQALQLASWNRELEARVQAQVTELERLSGLKRFLAPQIAEAIAAGGPEILRPHRRRVTVVFLDLRGFTAFAESSEPEEVMELLGEYHAAMGSLVMTHEGTLERFTGDGLMVFFNDPIELPDPERRAVQMALEMRAALQTLAERWRRRGHALELGIGITHGYATLGAIGFDQRRDYAAIGTVTNQAARLCEAAGGGQILISERLRTQVESWVETEPVGELALKGFQRAVPAHNVLRLRPLTPA
ncbi:MAG TPA: response regulator [Myxococcota bacterium]|nr:response regulator [Myxococcota bacterium]